MINEWLFIQKSIEELDRIAKNEPNPDRAKQLIKKFLREQKEKISDDLKW